MYEFKLPDIGEGLHEAELLEWDVAVGDTVAEGEPIAQVSTDKVNVELPSPCAGVITELPWKPGDVIPVGEVLARIDDGSDASATKNAEQAAGDERPAAQRPPREQHTRVRAAPAVRRYAAEQGVDLAEVAATGPGGAVTRVDIDNHTAPAGERSEKGVTRIALSGPRLAAAKRLEESWRTLATTAMTFEVPADAILSECERLSEDAGPVRMTPLAVIANSVCAALGEHPGFNAVIDEKARALDLCEDIHLGIAVDSPDGLLVPVIRRANAHNALELARLISDTAEGARAGNLPVSAFRGSTFTISSTGSLEAVDVTATTPVINFPNVATLWVSRIRDRPRVVDGKLGAGPLMHCTLAFDHRYLHGADATRFINTLGQRFAKPGG